MSATEQLPSTLDEPRTRAPAGDGRSCAKHRFGVAPMASSVLRTQGDERLLELARAGHERAFEVLVRRYRKPLLAHCRRLGLPEARAEDVVQGTFLAAWTSLDTATEVRHVRAWLYRITHNAALNALKRSGYDYAELPDSLPGGDAPEQDLERRAAVRETLAALAELPELQREALLRTAVRGCSHEQVAVDLGLSGTVVRGLVYRARVTVRTAVSAVLPPPLVMWAASRMHDSPLAQRVGDCAAAGGGSAGLVAVLAKGGAVVAAAGALATGAASLPVLDSPRSHIPSAPGTSRARQAASPATSGSPAIASRGPAGLSTLGGGVAPAVGPPRGRAARSGASPISSGRPATHTADSRGPRLGSDGGASTDGRNAGPGGTDLRGVSPGRDGGSGSGASSQGSGTRGASEGSGSSSTAGGGGSDRGSSAPVSGSSSGDGGPSPSAAAGTLEGPSPTSPASESSGHDSASSGGSGSAATAATSHGGGGSGDDSLGGTGSGAPPAN